MSVKLLSALVPPNMTTTQRDAIPAGKRPPGSMIFNTTTNRIEFNNGSDATPVWDISGPRVGAMDDYGGTADPDICWLLCDGRSLLRASYPALFAVLGTTYGSVDGTHFNIPDFRGRVAVMVDGAAGRLSANDAIGNSGGEEKHVLTIAELAAHSHGGVTGTHNQDHTHTMNHDHALQIDGLGRYGAGVPAGGVAASADLGGGGAGGPVKSFNGSTGGASVGHTHNISSEGSGTAHNTMMPYLVSNKIIRAL
jgi:microcystin-dependent protein